MKELSVEEKARRYDEAIEAIRKCKTDKYGGIIGIKASDLFPELVESEDERIRKEMLEYCYKRMNNEFPSITIHQVERWAVWLEEQGEQKVVWSDEDENHVKSILSTIECCKIQFPNAQAVVEAYNADIEWLKDLKDRYTWKSSDAQMKALNTINVTGCISCAEQGQKLIDLYNDLKKL